MIILANTNKVSQPGSTPYIWICLRSALRVWKWEKNDVVMCDEVNYSLLIFRLQHDGRTSDHISSLNLLINVHIQATSSLLPSINLVHPQLTWKVVISHTQSWPIMLMVWSWYWSWSWSWALTQENLQTLFDLFSSNMITAQTFPRNPQHCPEVSHHCWIQWAHI